MSGDILEQEERDDNKFMHMGYRVNDLSDSLGAALGKDDKLSVQTSIPNLDWPDLNYLIPSLHTTLVLIYFSMMVCILGGISSSMWKRFGISTKSQSKKEGIEKQLLGSGKYAQYVNAAVALKIYQQEMEKDTDSATDSESDCKENMNENSLINESVLIGGYKKTKKLRARTIRKQKVREQKENYQRYKKRLEYEKQLKRHNKMKEKKYVKKRARKIKQENKNKNKNVWFWNSIYNSYNSVVGVFEKDNNEQNELQSNEEMIDYKKKSTINHKKENKNNLEQMIICDCCNEIIIDLEKYYLGKIKSSDIYGEIVGDMKSFKKMIRSLAAKNEECEGLIDDDSNVYFRWNCECDAKLRCYIENSGKCQVKQTGEKMLAISKEVFTVNI